MLRSFVHSTLKRTLLSFGIKVTRASRFDYLFEKFVTQSSSKKVIQVGANDGVRFDGLFERIVHQRLPSLVVEPVPDYFVRLKAAYKDYPFVCPVQVAIHSVDKHSTIYRLNRIFADKYPEWADGCASFFREHLKKQGIADEHISSEPVPCMSFMSLVERHNMYDAAYLQIDTEGYDFEILKQVDFDQVRPSLIKYEHINLSDHDRREASAMLRRNGYSLSMDGEDAFAWQ